jgi:hypothetical protein
VLEDQRQTQQDLTPLFLNIDLGDLAKLRTGVAVVGHHILMQNHIRLEQTDEKMSLQQRWLWVE